MGDAKQLNPFGAIPRVTWAEKVEKDLKGRDPASLERKDPEGLRSQVLYTVEDAPATAPEPGVFPFVRGAAAGAAVGQLAPCLYPGSKLAAEAAELHAYGASSFFIDTRGRGEAPESWTWPEGLSNYFAIWSALEGPGAPLPASPGRRDLIAALDVDVAQATPEALAGCVSGLDAGTPRFLIDGVPAHEAGAGPVESIAQALAAGVQLARELEAGGVAADEALSHFVFNWALETHFFDAVCKLRAARSLWAELAAAMGVEGEAARMRIYAHSEGRSWTAVDPWVNLLRGTSECFAAQVAGADWISIAPFDLRHGNSELGRRMAVNTQVILREESHALEVADPAGGSYYLERRTEALRAAAWERFVAIEKAGGYREARKSGALAEAIAATAEARTKALRTGRDALVGISRFASESEGPIPAGEPARFEPAATLLAPLRLAEGFEALRARAEQRPVTMLLASRGPLKAYKPRADFARDVLRGGGVRLETAADVADPAASFDASRHAGVIVAATDEALAEPETLALIETLRTAGVSALWVVTRPGAVPAVEAKAEGCVHMRADALALLEQMHAAAPAAGTEANAKGGAQ